MERKRSPVSGINPTSATAAAHAAESAISAAVGTALHLSQPEASAEIIAAARECLADAAAGTRRNTLIIRATTGVGKTTAIARAVAECLAVIEHRLRGVLVVRDHTQTVGYQIALIAAGLNPLDISIYRGRTDVDGAREIDEQDDTVCYQMPSVSAVGARGHLPSASVCRMCPIGIAMGIKRLEEAIDEGRAEYVGQLSPQEQLEQRRGALKGALAGSRMSADTVDRIVKAGGCILHRAMPAYRAARVLIMTQQAYVDSHRVSDDDVPALVIADEGLELARPRETITGTVIDEWREQVRGAAVRTGRTYAGEDSAHAEVLETLRLVDLMRVEAGQRHRTLERFQQQVEKLKGNLYQSAVKGLMRTESEENYWPNRYTGQFALKFAISLTLRRRSVAFTVPLPIRQAHLSPQSESSATGSAPRDA